MASRAPACLPAPAHLSRLSFAIMSVRQTEQFAILTNSIASMQRQISELIDVTNRTTEWIHAQQARSVDIDKTLVYLRASMEPLQSTSVSSIETKSVDSDSPMPEVAGSARSGSNRRPSQSHTPSESVGISQPPGKKQKPSFSPTHKAPKNGINKTKSSFAVLFLSGSLVVRTRTLFRHFVLFPSLMLIGIPTRSSARRALIIFLTLTVSLHGESW